MGLSKKLARQEEVSIMGKASKHNFVRIVLAYLICFSWLISLPANSWAGNGNNGKSNGRNGTNTQAGQTEEVVVKLTGLANVDVVNALYGTRTLKTLAAEKTYLLEAPDHATVVNLIQGLVTTLQAEYVEPNYKLVATEAQQIFIYYDTSSSMQTSSQLLENQWAFNKIDLARSHSLSKGENISVAVIDTGVNSDHPGLTNRILPGYNAIDKTTNAQDDNGHGTFIAGIISQVAPSAKILPIKALDSDGVGTVFDAIEAIYYAVDKNVQVINLSMGLYDDSKGLATAVRYAQSKNVVVVASAGNSATNKKRYPAALAGVVGVAATNEINQKASFSNYAQNSSVTAPGVKIYSFYYTGGYGYGEGTSFAAPMVAGLAAQVWAKNPTAKANDISRKIEQSASSLRESDPDYGVFLGYGLINNYKALLN